MDNAAMSPKGVEASKGEWLILSLSIALLFAFATIFPRGNTWGLNSLAHLPRWFNVPLLGLALFSLVPSVQRYVFSRSRRFTDLLLQRSARGYALTALLGLTAFFLFYKFAIRTEVYGDTRTIVRFWDDPAGVRAAIAGLFDFHLEKNDAALTSALVRTIAKQFSLSAVEAFRIVSALSGALFVCLWTQFVRSSFEGSPWRGLLLLVGYLLGAHQIFFGHVETYAFVYLMTTMFLLGAWMALAGKTSPWLVAVLFLVAVRAHTFAVCLLPALLFMFAQLTAGRIPSLKAWLTWKGIAAWLVLPLLALGALAYMLRFKGLNTPHLGNGTEPSPMFLPLLPENGPWDYSIFSASHLGDLANVFLLVGASAIVIIVGLLAFHRRQIAWDEPVLKFAALGSLFPLLFFFAVNPLLSMPRDWDLYALLGAPLLILLAALLATVESRDMPVPAVYGAASAFSIFGIAFWILNVYPTGLSRHLELVGEHVFRTYHENASYIIGTAQGMDPDTTRAIARRVQTIHRLSPGVRQGDEEYTHLLMMLADESRAAGDVKQAIAAVNRAVEVSPTDRNLALFRADYLVWAGQTAEADRSLDVLLARDAQDFDALVLAAISAVTASRNDRALELLERAQKVRPEDADVATWITNVRKRMTKARPT